MPTPTVFISYSHKDEVWKDRLLEHLGGLEEEGLLKTWNDRDLGPGDEWFEEIRKAMEAASVAVFLVSASSLKSRFIRHQEIPRLLERRAKEGMVFFPVLVRSCIWQEYPWLAQFQVLPADDKPLAGFEGNRRDKELAKIAKGILDIVRDGSKPSIRIEQQNSPPAGTTLSSLHQLPAPPADFTGREEELNALRSALAKGGPGAIFGLRGAGGIGKTVLALKLAEELKPLYPDAQLYLDLKGTDPQPLTTAQAMAHVIRSYHPEARLPESEAELAGLYRSVLNDKRVLFLMDNAASREQVEPLIPPSGSLLLVTSRFHFVLPGLVSRDLDELPPEDARDLLLKIALRIGKEADVLAGLCGRLPIALRLAGSALAERPDLSPTDYARRLKEGKERFGAVEASLTVSYELLNEDRRCLWRLLAVFPGTFDPPAAAAIWELEIDPASEALGDLVRSSLVEWEEKDTRYRLHDLARSFADRQLAETEREVVKRRHAEYFLELLRSANDLYEQGGESLGLGLRLFDAEWGNIQAGFAWASSRFPQDETAARVCNGYPRAGAYLLSLRQHPREQIRWREHAIAAARRRKNRSSEGAHLGRLGNAYAELGETRRAIEFYEQQLAIARDIGDRREEGQALGNLGNAYAELGETRRAIELYEQHLTIAREIGDRRGEDQALGNLGNAYAELGETRRAIELYEQALTIDREIGDRLGESQDLGNLGLAYAALGETRRAIEHYEQQLAIARDIGDRRGEGNALGSLGNAYAALSETRRAIELYEQQLAIAREIGGRRSEGAALGNLGIAYAELGETRRAIEYHEPYLAIAREIGDRQGEGYALNNLGNAYAALGETRRAIELYEQQLAITREIGDRWGESNALGNLGIAYKNLGETRRAIELYEQVLAIARDIGNRRGEGNALGSLGIAYAALGETRRAIEYYEENLAIARDIGNRRDETIASWNLGLAIEEENLARAADLMQAYVDYLREIGHPDAEKRAARVAALRARIAEQGS